MGTFMVSGYHFAGICDMNKLEEYPETLVGYPKKEHCIFSLGFVVLL